jgi:hypothetical protein
MKTYKLIQMLESENIAARELGVAIAKAICKDKSKESFLMIAIINDHFKKKVNKTNKCYLRLKKTFDKKLASLLIANT